MMAFSLPVRPSTCLLPPSELCTLLCTLFCSAAACRHVPLNADLGPLALLIPS